MADNRAETGVKGVGVEALVGAGVFGPGGDAEGVSDGGILIWGEGGREDRGRYGRISRKDTVAC